MAEIITFVFLTLFITYVSRKSLRLPGSHGFYRFFAWECIALLFVANVDSWFKNPVSWHQLISWFLLVLSLIPLFFGIHHLKKQGEQAKERESEPQLFHFESTTQLVTTGIYHYIRHPLYSSLLLLTWGICFKTLSLTGICLAAVSTAFLFATAKADETECIRFFKDDYLEYMKRTKRFIPFLF